MLYISPYQFSNILALVRLRVMTTWNYVVQLSWQGTFFTEIALSVISNFIAFETISVYVDLRLQWNISAISKTNKKVYETMFFDM